MRIGLGLTGYCWPHSPASLGPTLARIGQEAEGAGVSSLWVMDHFFQIPLYGPPEQEMLESYTTLAYAAAQTTRINLGALVTGVSYRHPGVLIKIVTTLDVLSGGRTYLGIGAAWNEHEHRGLGVPFPSLAERFERLEETLQVARHMWAGDTRPFEGRHYHLTEPLNSPGPVRRPHPPILVGGGGERKTLRLVARYADACNLFEAFGVEELQRKLDVLRDHCAREGRPYAEIEKTTYGDLHLSRSGGPGTQTPDQAVERFHELAELGIDHAIVGLPNPHEPDAIELLGEVAARAEKITPAGRG